MEATPSLASASDDESYALSTGPLTPNASPLFCPIDTGIVIEKRLTSLLTEINGPRPTLSVHAAVPDRQEDHVSPTRKVCFIGAGYVGGPTAAMIALHNPSIEVYVYDRDANRIKRWQSAHLPIHEPGLEDIVRIPRDGAMSTRLDGTLDTTPTNRPPNLFFSTKAAESLGLADIVFLAVNTPTKTFGQGTGRATSMTAVDSAVRGLALHVKDKVVLVEKSTVPCGTAQRISKLLRSLRPELSFEVLSNPEFLSEGCAIDNLLRPDRVLIGSSRTPSGDAAASTLATLYSTWVPRTKICRTNTWSSELSKLVANAMLAQRISSINAISAICEETGADITEISHSVGLDPRIGPKFLKAGLGFGGSCFRKDIASLTYLAQSLGLDEVAEYWQQVNVMNNLQRRRFASKVIRLLDENLIGKKIVLLGFAFKNGTGDTRESLAVDVISQLLEERPKEIAIFDPCCKEEDIRREVVPVLEAGKAAYTHVRVCRDVYTACAQADAILIITDCEEFKTDGKMRFPGQPSLGSSHGEGGREVVLPSGLSFTLTPMTECPNGCAECGAQSSHHAASSKRIDWAQIARNMKDPRWVFDGRCILDVEDMDKLGFRVESIGRQTG